MNWGMLWQSVKGNVWPIVAGFMLSQAKLIVKYAALAVFKIPIVRQYLVGNPQQAKQLLADLVNEVDQDIDEAVAQAASASNVSPTISAGTSNQK